MRRSRGSAAIALLGSAAVLGSLLMVPPAQALVPNSVVSIPLGEIPWSVTTATDGSGPVYVGADDSTSNPPLLKIDPATNTVVATIPLTGAGGLVYVTAGAAAGGRVYASSSTAQTVNRIEASNLVTGTYSAAVKTYDIAVKGTAGIDDTLYVADDSGILVLDATTMTRDDSIPLSGGARYIATVGDDSIVVTTFSQNRVSIINASTDDSVSVTVPSPRDVAVSPDQNWAYVTSMDNSGSAARYLYRINARTGAVDDSVGYAGLGANSVAVAPNGVIYASLPFGSGRLVDIDPTTFDQDPFTLMVGTPQGIAIRPDGGIFVGSTTYAGGTLQAINSAPVPSPTPAPAYPADSPRDVVAVPGNTEATVSWRVPVYTGSFPISYYMVKSSPGGKICLAPAPTTSCTITGLANGTSYTFTVSALNGAGWGTPSAASDPVTPSAGKSLVITGSRSSRDRWMIVVKGSSVGLAGQKAVPHLKHPGPFPYLPVLGGPTIDAQGRFQWKWRTGLKAYVYFAAGGVKSNTVTIPGRW